MTREDINDIIKVLCPNDEDFEKPIISPEYLKKELEALALEQDSCDDVLDKIRTEILEYIDDLDIAYEICGVFDKYKAESEVQDADSN